MNQYKVVPVEPTAAMIHAAHVEIDSDGGRIDTAVRLAIAAAPEFDGVILTREEMDKITASLFEMSVVIGDSQGVAGYHLNGAIAQWDEFDEIEQISEVIKMLGDKW